MSRTDQSSAARLWSHSQVSWSDFLPQDRVNQFLVDNKLEWTQQVGIELVSLMIINFIIV